MGRAGDAAAVERGQPSFKQCETQAFDADAVERLCGNPDRFAGRLEGAPHFEQPMAAKDHSGFFDWDDPAVPNELRTAPALGSFEGRL